MPGLLQTIYSPVLHRPTRVLLASVGRLVTDVVIPEPLHRQVSFLPHDFGWTTPEAAVQFVRRGAQAVDFSEPFLFHGDTFGILILCEPDPNNGKNTVRVNRPLSIEEI